MVDRLRDSLYIIAAGILVILNGFFVAAEFALVKIRGSRLEEMVQQGRPFARSGLWLSERLDASLSACQLGITMASLGLGWIGEPAFARLLAPVLHWIGIDSEAAIHTIAFIIAFGLITALHLVIGEQAPKIFAIRRPDTMLLVCAAPLKFFYFLLYPLLTVLSKTTALLLRAVGIEDASEHDAPPTEAEIRRMLSQAHAHGELTRSEHRLLHAVFDFDDLITRRVMVPRNDIVFFDVNQPISECIKLARRAKHTRYPVCDGSLDNVLGIAHIKDLVGVSGEKSFNLRSILRPPRQIPETMPISRLLKHFQATHELMALVVDEHGTLVGFVTLENVLEEIVGPVEDEFDTEPPPIVEEGPRTFIVLGSSPVKVVNRRLGLGLASRDADTFSGLLTARLGSIPKAGDRVELENASAEVVEVKGARATRIRVTLPEPPEPMPS